MDLASFLNFYCRKIGVWLLSLLPIVLACALVILTLSPLEITDEYRSVHLITTALYIILIIIALPFSLNGFFMEQAFNAEIKRISSTGLLIRGVEGFKDIESSIKLLYRSSYSITASVIVSFFSIYISSFIEPYK